MRKRLIMSTSVGKKYFTAKEFPDMIWIETTSDCNLSCPFCPRLYSKRERKCIDKKLFIKALEEIRQENPNLKSLSPYCFGEPLYNPEIFDLIKLIKQYLPNTSVDMSTNAVLLTKEKADKLINSGVNFVSIWEKSFSPKTKENIRYFLEHVPKTMQVCIGFLLFKGGKKEMKKFLDEYKPYIRDNVSLRVMETHDWAGQVPSTNVMNKAHGLLKTPCQMPFNLCVIFSNGEVVPCCLDMNARYSGGNLKDSTIKEIWNGKVFTDLRERLLKGKIHNCELCWNCHYYRQPVGKTVKMVLKKKTAYNWDVKK